MPNGSEDLQLLRLIKAFQKITDQDARRRFVLHVEEQLEQQQARQREHRTDISLANGPTGVQP